MASGFTSLLSYVKCGYAELLGADLVPVYGDGTRKHIPQDPGVYVLHEAGKPLFVGRASYLRDRLGEQSLPGSDPDVAPLAQQLARDQIGRRVPSDELGSTPEFRAAKERVHGMSVRWVEEPDPDCRYLLQFCTAKKLRKHFQPPAKPEWPIWFHLRSEVERIADLSRARRR